MNMKRIFVDEKWCLSCHLCEYHCAHANLNGSEDMAKALMGVSIQPRIRVENGGNISFAVSCRHCDNPLCLTACITGAIHREDGVVCIDRERCVGCYTCVLSCPYGAVMPSRDGAAMKCELCVNNHEGTLACVAHCPNRAIYYDEGVVER